VDGRSFPRLAALLQSMESIIGRIRANKVILFLFTVMFLYLN